MKRSKAYQRIMELRKVFETGDMSIFQIHEYRKWKQLPEREAVHFMRHVLDHTEEEIQLVIARVLEPPEIPEVGQSYASTYPLYLEYSFKAG